MALTMTAQKDFDVNSTPSFFVEGERVEFSTFEELMAKLDEAIGDAS